MTRSVTPDLIRGLPAFVPSRTEGGSRLKAGMTLEEQRSRLRIVVAHLRREGVHAVELALVADEGVERDFDGAAVEVAVEVEDVGFEKLLRRLEGGADAEIGDAGVLAAIVEDHAHGIDAVARPLIVAELKVGGRIAKLAAALVAGLDDAGDRIGAAQHSGGGGGVAGDERLSDP